MDETVVSFNYQDYGLLIRYTCSIFFQFHIYDQFNEFIQSGRTTTTGWVTIFEGKGGVVEGKSLLRSSMFFWASRCVKIETKTAAYDTTEEAYVYVFVTTTIST